ncbi:hypothetical protein C6496_14120 [Candidatus Poribacteria bacterium]|nr:MAG: hypothetical protein C6496_14120 [Candidatus Poribacteria bacterium]
MRFNHTNPTGRGSEALRDMLLTAEEREVFRRPLPGNFPPNQVPSVENPLKIDPDPKAGWGPQWNNFSQLDSRFPNDQEATALIFTFGDTVGKILIDTIKIRQGTGETDDKTEVLLHKNYKSEELAWLGIFIYKATRVWQKHVGLYHQRKGQRDYNYKQLYALNLNGKQHAEAVKHWFYVSYGNVHRLIGSGAQRLTLDELWKMILPALGLDFQYKKRFGYRVTDLQQVVNNHYGCVIKEIRDANKFYRLGQNFPNPF